MDSPDAASRGLIFLRADRLPSSDPMSLRLRAALSALRALPARAAASFGRNPRRASGIDGRRSAGGNGRGRPPPALTAWRCAGKKEAARWRRRPAGRGFRKRIEGGGFDPFSAVSDRPAGPQHRVPEELAPELCAVGQIGKSDLLLLNRTLRKNAIVQPQNLQIFPLNALNHCILEGCVLIHGIHC